MQFSEIEGLDAARLGLVWNKFRQDFPRVETQPPLGKILETEGLPDPARIGFQIEDAPPPARMWFLTEDGTQLIQIQRDRFAFNWRKLDTDRKYPHYDQVRGDFVRQLEKFLDFLREESLEDLDPDQVELTYVNHILAEKRRDGLSPLENSLRLWAGIPSEARIPDPELVSFQTQFPLREEQDFLGRLYIQLQSRFLIRDNSPVYQLQLTARGAPIAEDSGVPGVLEFLDKGHIWIVRTFADITTTEMHKKWKRRQ